MSIAQEIECANMILRLPSVSASVKQSLRQRLKLLCAMRDVFAMIREAA